MAKHNNEGKFILFSWVYFESIGQQRGFPAVLKKDHDETNMVKHDEIAL